MDDKVRQLIEDAAKDLAQGKQSESLRRLLNLIELGQMTEKAITLAIEPHHKCVIEPETKTEFRHLKVIPGGL